MSSQNIQSSYTSHPTSALISSQPFMMYAINLLVLISCISSHVSCVDMNSGMSVQVSMVLMLILEISTPFFSQSFCHDSRSAMYRSGPSLYNLHILYWGMICRMYCCLCDSVPTSFSKCSYQWFVICNYTDLPDKYL